MTRTTSWAGVTTVALALAPVHGFLAGLGGSVARVDRTSLYAGTSRNNMDLQVLPDHLEQNSLLGSHVMFLHVKPPRSRHSNLSGWTTRKKSGLVEWRSQNCLIASRMPSILQWSAREAHLRPVTTASASTLTPLPATRRTPRSRIRSHWYVFRSSSACAQNLRVQVVQLTRECLSLCAIHIGTDVCRGYGQDGDGTIGARG